MSGGWLAAVLIALAMLTGCSGPFAPGDALTITASDPALHPAGMPVLPPSDHVTGSYPAHCHAVGTPAKPRPDAGCTPGSVRSDVTAQTIAQTICIPHWTDTVRPSSTETNRMKTTAMIAYGEPATTRATTEFDHQVPLELGGSNDVSNLWPEPGPGPTVINPKDAVENRLHDAVCSHRVPLAAAQVAIAHDWTTAERRLGIAE